MELTPWSHDNPFTPGTLIRADEMNAALQGIATSLDAFATDLANFVVRLPENFTGENQIPDQTATERLLYIDAQGNMGFYAVTQFQEDVQRTQTLAQEVAQNTEDTRNYRDQAQQYAQQAADASGSVSYSWNTITNKPSTFPPSSHGHPMGEVSGLTDALAAQSTSSVYHNSNQTITRLGRVTEVCSASTGNVTKTLDMSTFLVGDIVRIHKTQQQGDLTIATDAGAIQIPNATQATSHVVRDGDITVVNLFKITSTLWALSLY